MSEIEGPKRMGGEVEAPKGDVDWYATGLAMLRDHGESAVDCAAAILQNALGELLRKAPERRVLTKETTKSPRRLALQAVGAFETAGGLYQIVLRKLDPKERSDFDEALRERGRMMLEEGKGRLEFKEPSAEE